MSPKARRDTTDVDWLQKRIDALDPIPFAVLPSNGKAFVNFAMKAHTGGFRNAPYAAGDAVTLTGVYRGKKELVFTFSSRETNAGPRTGHGHPFQHAELTETRACNGLNAFKEWLHKTLDEEFDQAVEEVDRTLHDEEEEERLEEERETLPGWGVW